MAIFLSEIINLASIFAFLIGILSGFLLAAAVLVIIVSSKIKVKTIKSPTVEAIDDDKIKEMSLEKSSVLISVLEESGFDAKAMGDIIMELIHEIASYYFPESESPEYELTMSEAVELIGYIKIRLDELLNKPLFRYLKPVTITQVVGIINNVAFSPEAKAIKAGKETYDWFKAITSLVNPVYWIRKTAITPVMFIALKKLCKSIVLIIGDETNKIYSKKLFKDASSERIDVEEIFNDEGDDENAI